jgi:hypothetical protein
MKLVLLARHGLEPKGRGSAENAKFGEARQVRSLGIVYAMLAAARLTSQIKNLEFVVERSKCSNDVVMGIGVSESCLEVLQVRCVPRNARDMAFFDNEVAEIYTVEFPEIKASFDVGWEVRHLEAAGGCLRVVNEFACSCLPIQYVFRGNGRMHEDALEDGVF